MPVNKNIKYFWALMLCLVASVTTLAQQKNPMFYKEIQLQHKPYTLQSITEEIQAQTGISFSYNADRINPNTKVKLKGDKLTVAAILNILQKKTDIDYKIISQNHIIYTESGKQQRRAVKPKKLKYHTKKTIRNTEKESIAKRQTAPVKSYDIAKTSTITDSSENNTIIIVGDSSMVSSYYLGGGYGGGGNNETEEEQASAFPENEWDDVPNKYAARNRGANKEDILKFFKANTLFAAGLSTDETYYCNPSLRMGFDFLYGTISYNLGGTNTWRFGLGASAKINDKWSIHFNISSGQSISNDYDIIKFDTIPPNDSFQDPTIIQTHSPLSVSSKLTRYGISTSYDLGKGFLLEGGIVLNQLKTKYYSNSNPIALSDILPFGLDADSKYYGIKPPYVIGNSFSANKSSNTKVWIGFQITFLYRLNFLGY